MKVKIFRFLGQEIPFLVLARQFFIANLSLSIPPPIFVVCESYCPYFLLH
ncbi:hypothetical protein NC651_007909 [Populus alba x Populus x berolinensis]|nr:hypothetical protein NC651_007909 [Populus alba x Populus x berolinensis]